MPRSNSDNLGDIAPDRPTPNNVPSENAQLEQRGLNTTGLPEGVRDNERELEKEATSGHKDDGAVASTTRRRKNKGEEDNGLGDPFQDGDKEEEKHKSLSFRDRLRSPLGSGLKLDELRETISNGVEVKYAFVTEDIYAYADG